MSDHEASAPMLGYLYQLHASLFLLLADDNERVKVCLEKYDDVTIVDEKGNQKFYQLKLHTKQNGDLTDASTDLWRTLKVWLDWYISDSNDTPDTKFTIITNANAPQSSAASNLLLENRDIIRAYNILKNIAETSKNKSHKQYYKAFLDLPQKKAEQFLHSVFILERGGNIQTTDDKIKNEIKYSVNTQHISSLFERLLGWWVKKSEDALISNNPVFISQWDVRSKIVQIASEYRDDNLPIDDFDEVSVPENTEKVFQAQLRLLFIGNKRLRLATKNYYRAFTQRNKWVNEGLPFIGELDKYDNRLREEWEHRFVQMEDKLNATETITEVEKRAQGIDLLNKIEDKDIRIREKVSEPFVMRGSYHMLADDMQIGWHIDFKEQLGKSILNSEVGHEKLG